MFVHFSQVWHDKHIFYPKLLSVGQTSSWDRFIMISKCQDKISAI
jgi:hypothetical protein